MKKLLFIIGFISFTITIYSQPTDWINFTAGSETYRIAREGNFLWTTGGGLNKYNILTTENMNYNHLNSGLPANDAMAIAVDKLGNKWIGMYSGDLVKFDGATWTVYPTPRPDLQIMDIVIDSNNIVWVGSWYGGLLSFDGTTWTVYDESNSGLPNNYVLCLNIDLENNLWIGMTGNLAKFDRSTFTVYNSENSGLPGVAVSSILIDTLGIKWIGTQQGGLVKFDDATWTRYGLTEGSSGDAIAIDKDYNKWVGCGSSLFKLNDSSAVQYDAPSRTSNIESIQIDQYGNKWIGTLTHGMYKFDNGSWTVAKTGNSGLAQDRMWSIFIDDSGNKWIGTEQRGADKFDGIEWTNFPMFNPLWGGNYSPGVMQITGDTEGNIWFATEQGVGKYDGNEMVMYTPENSPLPDWIVESVAIGQNGVKWFGTRAGLAKFDGVTWEIFDQSNSVIPGNMVKDLAIDNEGIIWMGFRDGGGIAKFNGNEWVIFPSGPNGPATSSAWDLFFDLEGNLWVAGGMCQIASKFDGVNWTHLPNLYQCYSIAQDKNSNIWSAGLYMGLKKFDGSEWTTYNTNNSGLSSNMATVVTIDGAGNKWIGTYGGGLSVFNENGINMPPYFTNTPADTLRAKPGSLITFRFQSQNPDGDPLKYSLSFAGANAKIDSITGIFQYQSNKPIIEQFEVIVRDGHDSIFNTFVVKIDKSIGINDLENSAIATLAQNYPNPFFGNSTISFTLIKGGYVSLKVYNLLGQEVTTLLSKELNLGTYNNIFNAGDLPAGIYTYRLEVNGFVLTKKMAIAD